MTRIYAMLGLRSIRSRRTLNLQSSIENIQSFKVSEIIWIQFLSW
ncbi:hypothetical protein D1BOALGB6SA_809 [Olavius sp. associated proteobacterium Delta 1]|nr:hypothetical protein D1BOALGB6SA_809 [Olavius sp. associated proteobacterium Delta 1]